MSKIKPRRQLLTPLSVEKLERIQASLPRNSKEEKPMTFNIDTHNWGGAGIGRTVFHFICNLLPEGSTMVELGGGNSSTVAFASRYKVYTVEQNPSFVDPSIETTWIHAPTEVPKDGKMWYNRAIVEKGLPNDYDLLFIDGPAGSGNRSGILDNMDLIPKNCKILLHDTCRPLEKELAEELAKRLNKTALYYSNGITSHGLNDWWVYLADEEDLNNNYSYSLAGGYHDRSSRFLTKTVALGLSKFLTIDKSNP